MAKTFLEELREANKARQREWTRGESVPPLFRALEVCGEAGELANHVKKEYRESRGWRGSRSTTEDIAKEIADVLITLDLLAGEYGIDLELTTRNKFNETSTAQNLSVFL